MMITFVCQIVTALIVTFLALPTMSQDVELSSTLHSTIYGVPVAYIDETVMFNCVVRESNSMAWTSEEYIGTGGQQLEFLAAEHPGSTLTAIRNNRTIAELVNTTGREFIVSRLQITIAPNFHTASVQCRNINANRTASIAFLLADATSVTCDRRSTCPGDRVTCTCTTGNSNTLVWTTNENRLMFAANDPPLTRRNVNGSGTSAMLTGNSARNGIRVIMSNITFFASISNVLTCGNVDRSTSESVIVPVSETCPDTFNQVTTSARNDVGDTCTGAIAAAVAVPIVIVIISVVTVIIVVIVCTKTTKEKMKKEKSQLETDLRETRAKVDNLEVEKGNLKTKFEDEEAKVKKLEVEKGNLKKKFKDEEAKVKNLEVEKGNLKKKFEDEEAKVKNLEVEKGNLEKKLKEEAKTSSRSKKKSTNQPPDREQLQLPLKGKEAESRGSGRLSPKSPKSPIKQRRPGSPFNPK